MTPSSSKRWSLHRSQGGSDSRWALAWYEQFGFGTGPYGDAETLSKAKNTSVEGMVEAGIVASKAGDVRLLRPAELDPAWDPRADVNRPGSDGNSGLDAFDTSARHV